MTEQEKREKVIANVTAIVSDMQEEVDEWKDYSDSELSHGLTCDCDWWYKTLQTLKDALALLKAQEPRVMTLEEVLAWAEMPAEKREPIFFEQRKGPNGWIANSACPKDYYLYCEDGDARCWTSRPTDAQREATPWN